MSVILDKEDNCVTICNKCIKDLAFLQCGHPGQPYQLHTLIESKKNFSWCKVKLICLTCKKMIDKFLSSLWDQSKVNLDPPKKKERNIGEKILMHNEARNNPPSSGWERVRSLLKMIYLNGCQGRFNYCHLKNRSHLWAACLGILLFFIHVYSYNSHSQLYSNDISMSQKSMMICIARRKCWF